MSKTKKHIKIKERHVKSIKDVINKKTITHIQRCQSIRLADNPLFSDFRIQDLFNGLSMTSGQVLWMINVLLTGFTVNYSS